MEVKRKMKTDRGLKLSTNYIPVKLGGNRISNRWNYFTSRKKSREVAQGIDR